jgi:hypothetical protein
MNIFEFLLKANQKKLFALITFLNILLLYLYALNSVGKPTFLEITILIILAPICTAFLYASLAFLEILWEHIVEPLWKAIKAWLQK